MIKKKLIYICTLCSSIVIFSLLFFNETHAVENVIKEQPKNQTTFILELSDTAVNAITSTKTKWWMSPLIIALAAIIASVLTIIFGIRKQIETQQQTINSLEKLKRIDLQLSNFYAPLLALSQASNMLYIKFVEEEKRSKKHYFEKAFDGTDKIPSTENIENWKRVMKNVFFPINEKREILVLEHAGLIVDDILPRILVEMVTHIAEFRSVMKKWDEHKSPADAMDAFNKNGDEEFRPTIEFPGEKLEEYAENGFNKLMSDKKNILNI